MPELPSRRLSLADLGIMIAVVAVSLMLWRISRETLLLEVGPSSSFSTAYKIGVWPGPVLLSFATGLLLARMLKPRPFRSDIFRQPGIAASMMILLHMLMVVLSLSWHDLMQSRVTNPNGPAAYHPNFNIYLYTNRTAGGWILASWSTLALSGSWKPESSWIDRTGIALGVIAMMQWIASILI